MNEPRPPTLPGLPVLGNWIEYQRDPVGLIRRGHRQLGEIFTIRLGPRRIIVMIGPEHQRFFFESSGTHLSRRRSLAWMVPMFGETFPIAAEGAAHERNTAVFPRAFHESRLAAYVERMHAIAAQKIGAIRPGTVVELHEAVYSWILEMHATVMLGESAVRLLGPQLPELMRNLAVGTDGHLTRHFGRLLPRGTRRRASAALFDAVRADLESRRSAESPGDDFMGALLAASRDSEAPCSDDELVNMLIGFTWAGLDTTVGQLCWTVVLLLQHEEARARVQAEVLEIASGQGPIGLQQLDAMTYLHAVITEAERLRPTVQVIGRDVVEPISHAGYRFPVGWGVIVCPPVAHRLPALFPRPDTFDPERFTSPRSDGRDRFNLIGFGGGRRVCTGKRLATASMKLVVASMLRAHDLELLDPEPVPTAGPHTNRPASPVRIRMGAAGR